MSTKNSAVVEEFLNAKASRSHFHLFRRVIHECKRVNASRTLYSLNAWKISVLKKILFNKFD